MPWHEEYIAYHYFNLQYFEFFWKKLIKKSNFFPKHFNHKFFGQENSYVSAKNCYRFLLFRRFFSKILIKSFYYDLVLLIYSDRKNNKKNF